MEYFLPPQGRVVARAQGSFSSQAQFTAQALTVYPDGQGSFSAQASFLGNAIRVFAGPVGQFFSAASFWGYPSVSASLTGLFSAQAQFTALALTVAQASGQFSMQETNVAFAIVVNPVSGAFSSQAQFTAQARVIARPAAQWNAVGLFTLGAPRVVFQASGAFTSHMTAEGVVTRVFRAPVGTSNAQAQFTAQALPVAQAEGSWASFAFWTGLLSIPSASGLFTAHLTMTAFATVVYPQRGSFQASATFSGLAHEVVRAQGSFLGSSHFVGLANLLVFAQGAWTSHLTWEALETVYQSQFPALSRIWTLGPEASLEGLSLTRAELTLRGSEVQASISEPQVTHETKTTEGIIWTDMELYTAGQVIQFRATFSFDGQTLTSEQLGNLSIHVKPPGNAAPLVLTGEFTQTPSGEWRRNLVTVGFVQGLYQYYWKSDGDYGCVGQGAFTIKPTPF